MPGKQILGKVALIPFGFVLAILALELALQLGALAVRLGGSSVPTSWATGDRRILCLGDSNTYGVWLMQRERDAYPAQLEAVWNEGNPQPVEVLNLGYPGTNSSRLLAMYQELLDVFRPDIVIVMIGVNDFWTRPVPLEVSEPAWDVLGFVQRHSRVQRGYSMLKRRLEPAELKIEKKSGELGGTRGEGIAQFGDHEFVFVWEHRDGRAGEGHQAKAAHDLRENLTALVTLSESSSAELILMTYPGRYDYYGTANEVIRVTAQAMEIPLVDLEAIFRPLCPEEDCPAWLYRDQHPKASGYLRVAERLTQQLLELAR